MAEQDQSLHRELYSVVVAEIHLRPAKVRCSVLAKTRQLEALVSSARAVNHNQLRTPQATSHPLEASLAHRAMLLPVRSAERKIHPQAKGKANLRVSHLAVVELAAAVKHRPSFRAALRHRILHPNQNQCSPLRKMTGPNRARQTPSHHSSVRAPRHRKQPAVAAYLARKRRPNNQKIRNRIQQRRFLRRRH